MSSFAPVPVMPVAAPTWRQLGVFVIDASISMTLPFAEPQDVTVQGLPQRTKAQAVDCAVSEFMSRIKRSRNAANFHFAFVSFHHEVSDVRVPRGLLEIEESESFDPTANGTGGTSIQAGLEAAEAIVADFMGVHAAGEVPVSAVICVLSDGEDGGDLAQTFAVANRARTLPNTLIAAGLFATDSQEAPGQAVLQSIVSRPDLYRAVSDGEQLRTFFQASMTAMPLSASGAQAA